MAQGFIRSPAVLRSWADTQASDSTMTGFPFCQRAGGADPQTDMLNPFSMEGGGHMGHIKLSPGHQANALHHQQFTHQQNGYGHVSAATYPRDYLLRRDHMQGFTDTFGATAGPLHHDPSHMIFTGMVPDPHHHHAQMRLALPGTDMYGRTDSFNHSHHHHHQMARTDHFAAPYHPHAAHHMAQPGAFFRYMRSPIKEEFTCLWIDPENQITKKPCNKMFSLLQEFVSHISNDHVGGPECTNHTCCWQDCQRNGKPFKAKYKLINHIRDQWVKSTGGQTTWGWRSFPRSGNSTEQ
ncbi:zinc finger protein ZIC 1 [Caerostris darwini]|uniref:Zinc finger protein ZIC 1 n=1 Tax=Caerostris darwini TaxID=1538125 RepID=A0AAV4WD49_9ARAC|nr:zinc finger protein ZIC 1 [Caerostris darwini]